jgi:serine/threonine-protein kinase
MARFQREAQVLASLSHPHIGGIFGLEETDGIRALVMERRARRQSRAPSMKGS